MYNQNTFHKMAKRNTTDGSNLHVAKAGTYSSNYSGRYDGWNNVFTGSGITGMDRRASDDFKTEKILSFGEVEDLYRSAGFAKRIVEVITTESTREWISIMGDKDGEVYHKLNQLRARSEVSNLIRWSQVFGGAILVMGINDGGDLQDPVNEDNIQEIEFLRPYDRSQLTIFPEDRYDDPNRPKFGEPRLYTIVSTDTGIPTGEPMFKVHESRVLRMDGEPLPNRLKRSNRGWGDSLYQSIFTELANLSQSYNYTANIIADFMQAVFSIENLSDLLQSEDGEAQVQKRMEILNYSRSVNNTAILDNEETYSKHHSAVNGLDMLLDKLMQALSAVTGIPEMVLMGKTPKGLFAKGDNDIRSFYDRLKSFQQDKIYPNLHKLVEYIIKSEEISYEPERWDIIFNPLWQLTEEEKVNMRGQQAQTDQIYMSSGVLTPEEVKRSRFGTVEQPKAYSIETVPLTNEIQEAELEQDPNASNDTPPSQNSIPQPSEGETQGTAEQDITNP